MKVVIFLIHVYAFIDLKMIFLATLFYKLHNQATPTHYKVKVGNCSRGGPGGSLFYSYDTDSTLIKKN